MPRVGVQRAVQGQHLGAGQKGVQVGHPLPRPGQRPRRQQRVVGRDPHAEGVGEARDLGPDGAVADDAERNALGVAGHAGGLLPKPVPHAGLHGGQVLQHGEHQRHGVLGDRAGIGPGGARHGQAAGLGGGEVDAVHAGAVPRHDPQVGRRGVHDRAVDEALPVQHGDRAVLGDGGEQFGLGGVPGGAGNRVAGLLQDGDGLRRELRGGDEDGGLRGVWHEALSR
jgi:hypothetical protein